MVDYAELSLDSDRDAGVLELRGVTSGNLARRVYAGPRPEPDQSCGRIAVYAAGHDRNLGELYATPANLAHFRLWALKPDTGSGALRFVAARLSTEEVGDGTSPRWGVLKLRAVNRAGNAWGDIVRIGTDRDNLRGSVRLSDPNPSATGFIALEVDEFGPVLFMTDGERAITITPQGVEGWPDKGEWSFVADHPTDDEAEIHYNVLEGPEVGVYARGTARLSAGRATVSLPEHFAHVASPEGLTAQLTPRSGDSKGVAACRLSAQELEIVELLGGTGDYDVDYAVHGIRKGREGFKVVRPKRRRVARGVPRPATRDGEDEVSDVGT